MGAPDVLARLSALGVRLRRQGDDLIATPRSALTDDARTMIRFHKAELLAALADRRAEVRRLVEAIAKAAPSDWSAQDVEEAVRNAQGDLDDALMTFRAIAEQRHAVIH